MSAYERLPLSFEEADGQTDARGEFLSKGAGYTLLLTAGEATLALEKPTIGVQPSRPGSEPRRSKFESHGSPSSRNRAALVGRYSDLSAFVSKLHPAGCALAYSTYISGLFSSSGDGIAVDGAGDAYITGGTNSSDFPTVNPIQASCRSCQAGSTTTQSAPFIVELDPAGSRLLYSTYLSGSPTPSATIGDEGAAIAVDSTGNAYVAGRTASGSFPTANAFQAAFGGQEDAFVAKLNPATIPSIVLNPTRLSFGTEIVGTASAPQKVTLTNQSTNAVSISSIAIEGQDYTQTNNCGTSVAAGASCTINVTFRPTTEGVSPLILLTINDNAFGGPHVVGLYGSAVTPPAVFFPGLAGNLIVFESTAVGSTIGPDAVTLLNSGGSPLSISSVTLTDGDFSQTNNCASTVGPFQTCTINVAFKPTTLGNHAGTITIVDNAAGSPQQIQLSGAGLDFALSTSSATATISPGQQATWTLTVTPEGGLTGPVSLACTGAPQLATCSLSSNAVTLDGVHAVTVNVTVTTAAGSRLSLGPGSRSPRGRDPRPLIAWLVLFLALFTAATAARRKRRLTWAGVALLLVLTVPAASCGGGVGGGGGGGGSNQNSGTPRGSYTLTLTATGSAPAQVGTVKVIHSATVTLIVQ